MESIKDIYMIKELILSSPIRKKLKEDINLPYKSIISNPLNEVLDSIKAIENNKERPLNIVVIGEVKAGKSSFVNALIGGEISDVDVLETTSKIIEISYSKEANIKEYENKIQIKLNIDYLKKINIVDTPGLKSITSKNEQKTLNYIKNADLIIFVLDATHLGQEDIIEALDIICEYKTNIIGVVNKCDLLNSNKEEVFEYIKDEYGIYMNNFFMISSYIEYNAKVNCNIKVKSTDLVISNYNELRRNFNELNKFIYDLHKNFKQNKMDSINSSIERIIHKDIINHSDYMKSLSLVSDEFIKYEKSLQNKYDYIMSKMNFEIRDWVNREFFSEEIKKINQNIDNVKNYINENYINQIINKKKVELDNLFFGEWGQCLKEISEEMEDDIKKYVQKITYKNELIDTKSFKLEKGENDFNNLLAVVGTGAVLGATSGSVVSLYTALLSSSATSITIGSALMTYCPPLLIAGTISGAIGKIIYDKVQNDKKNKEVLNNADNFINDLKYKIIEELIKIYENCSKEIVYTTLEILKNIKGIQTSKYEIEVLNKEIGEYLLSLKKIECI